MSAPANIIDILTQRANGPAQRVGALDEALGASREREGEARLAQDLEMAPVQGKLKEKLEQGAPELPGQTPMPQAPAAPGIDPKEMTETLSLITALAALGGALTRQPLTAALNNFSAGVKGLVTGNQMAFQNSIKEFETNLQKARNENEATWKRYQAAREKYKADIAGLQQELKLIAAETQSPIDLEMATRGDVVSLYKAREKAEEQFDKVMGTVAKLKDAEARRAETKRVHDAQIAKWQSQEARLKEKAGGKDPQDKITKEFQDKARALHVRAIRDYDKAAGDPKRQAEVNRRYEEDIKVLEAEMRSRGFTGKLSMGAGPPSAPGAAGASPEASAKGAAAPSPTTIPGKYDSADAVKAAAQSGELSRDDALAILRRDFGFE